MSAGMGRTRAAILGMISIALLVATAAAAAVVCARTGRPLVLRAEKCRAKETVLPLAGPMGPAGATGPAGAPGVPGPLTARLPAGVTLRGNYALSLSAGADDLQRVFAPISFGFMAAVQARYVSAAASVPECPGTAEFPDAAPGYLCVYEIYRANLIQPFVCPGERPFLGDIGSDCPGADAFGAVVGGHPEGPGRVTLTGSWAVTSNGL